MLVKPFPRPISFFEFGVIIGEIILVVDVVTLVEPNISLLFSCSLGAQNLRPRRGKSGATHLLRVGHLDLLVEGVIADGSVAPGPEKLQDETC